MSIIVFNTSLLNNIFSPSDYSILKSLLNSFNDLIILSSTDLWYDKIIINIYSDLLYLLNSVYYK